MPFAFDDNGNALLVKPDRRGWGAPGGHVEPGETPDECVKREVYEGGDVVMDNLKVMSYRRISKLFMTATTTGTLIMLIFCFT